MDQPPQHTPPINTEGIIASILSVLATLGAIFVRGRFRVKSIREKVRAESEPLIERDYLEANEKITAAWQGEVEKLRAQIDRVRDEGRQELIASRKEVMDWMQRALSCESLVPALRAEIDTLKERVRVLEEEQRAAAKRLRP